MDALDAAAHAIMETNRSGSGRGSCMLAPRRNFGPPSLLVYSNTGTSRRRLCEHEIPRAPCVRNPARTAVHGDRERTPVLVGTRRSSRVPRRADVTLPSDDQEGVDGEHQQGDHDQDDHDSAVQPTYSDSLYAASLGLLGEVHRGHDGGANDDHPCRDALSAEGHRESDRPNRFMAMITAARRARCAPGPRSAGPSSARLR